LEVFNGVVLLESRLLLLKTRKDNLTGRRVIHLKDLRDNIVEALEPVV